jgi:hypothetical protein
MPNLTELTWLDATALADLVRRREVTPLELVEAAIERIERVNPQLNAVIRPMFEEARATASSDLPDGPFRGVPFLLKDLTAAYAGVPMTAGSSYLRDFIPNHDTELVTRHKASRTDRDRQNEHPGVRDYADDGASIVRGDAKSVGSLAHSGWFKRWFGGCGCSRPGPDGSCQRWRRLDSHSGFVLRPLWTQTDEGTQSTGS